MVSPFCVTLRVHKLLKKRKGMRWQKPKEYEKLHIFWISIESTDIFFNTRNILFSNKTLTHSKPKERHKINSELIFKITKKWHNNEIKTFYENSIYGKTLFSVCDHLITLEKSPDSLAQTYPFVCPSIARHKKPLTASTHTQTTQKYSPDCGSHSPHHSHSQKWIKAHLRSKHHHTNNLWSWHRSPVSRSSLRSSLLAHTHFTFFSVTHHPESVETVSISHFVTSSLFIFDLQFIFHWFSNLMCCWNIFQTAQNLNPTINTHS